MYNCTSLNFQHIPIYVQTTTWWRHQMETFSALLAICAGNSPDPGEFSAQRPVTRSFDDFFVLRPNKRLSKQRWGWWFETPSSPLLRHCNEIFLTRGRQSMWLRSLITLMTSWYGNVFRITGPLCCYSNANIFCKHNHTQIQTHKIPALRQEYSRKNRAIALLRMAWLYLSPVYQHPWASYQIRKIAGCVCAGNAGNVFPATVG